MKRLLIGVSAWLVTLGVSVVLFGNPTPLPPPEKCLLV